MTDLTLTILLQALWKSIVQRLQTIAMWMLNAQLRVIAMVVQLIVQRED